MNPRRLTGRLVLACACMLMLLPRTSQAQVGKYESFYVFGDSLADVGNLFQLTTLLGVDPAVPASVTPHAAYYQGRFSNGPVAFEYLWGRLTGAPTGATGVVAPSFPLLTLPETGAVDFAFGGTGTGVFDPLPGGLLSAPGLKGQVDEFAALLGGTGPRERALYAIFTGANDYLNPLSHQQTPPEVVGNIVESIAKLYRMGARDILVMYLPDLGLTPFSGANSDRLSQVSREHNKLLKTELHKLAAHLKGLNLVDVDPNVVLRHRLPKGMDATTPALDVIFPPELFGDTGFRMSLCLFIGPATCADVPTFSLPSPGLLFWDSVHPTTVVHRLFADLMYESLKH